MKFSIAKPATMAYEGEQSSTHDRKMPTTATRINEQTVNTIIGILSRIAARLSLSVEVTFAKASCSMPINKKDSSWDLLHVLR